MNILKFLYLIICGVIYGLIIKYTNKDVAIITLLILIYVELYFKEEK